MTVTYTKEKVQRYEIELFKTAITPTDSILWDSVLVPFAEIQGYTTEEESNIVIASYQAYLNCLQNKGEIISKTKIDKVEVTYAGNSNRNTTSCIDKIYSILDSLNIDVDFGENESNFLGYVAGGGCK